MIEPVKIQQSHLRQFGFAAAILAGAAGFWFGGVSTSPTTIGWLLFAALLGLSAALAPQRLRVPFVLLSAITAPIGWVVSHLILGLIYFAVVTPIGLALRLTGRSSMETDIDRAAESYWQRRPPPPKVEDYLRQS